LTRAESTPDFKGWYALPVLLPGFFIVALFFSYLVVYKQVDGLDRTVMAVVVSVLWSLFGIIAWEYNPYREPAWRPSMWMHRSSIEAQKSEGAVLKTESLVDRIVF
jgi:hypothetical protein